MVKAGIIGVSGYSGLTTLEILLKHPGAEVSYVSANNNTGKVADIWPHLAGKTDLVAEAYDANKAIELCDVLFLAVPHTVAMQLAPQLLDAGKKVIDLSGDYRLKSAADYKKWYGKDHADSDNLEKAVYGIPEFYREEIKKANLVSNPGCYPTAAILALAPLVATQNGSIESIMIDAKSGVTGAGRKATEEFEQSDNKENFKAYKVLHHQHAPEMDLYLSKLASKDVHVNFVPHLLPVKRGILETIYVQLNKKVNTKDLHKVYERFFKTEKFVKIVPSGEQPELNNVVGTNECQIAVEEARGKKLVVITSVIDNLLKGAAGQAVQNMNLMCGLKEDEGLT